eukprot:354187-Chlamydomonas_euryale.AAC.3
MSALVCQAGISVSQRINSDPHAIPCLFPSRRAANALRAVSVATPLCNGRAHGPSIAGLSIVGLREPAVLPYHFCSLTTPAL